MAQTDTLIVVDVQNGFINDRSRHVVDPIVRFVEGWLSGGRRVIATRFINPVGSQWESLIHWTRLREAPEIDLVPQLLEAMGDGESVRVIDKFTYSSLTDDVLDSIGPPNGQRVLVCGIATDGCVLKTAVDLFERGYTPIVLEDLCSSHAGNEVHAAGLLLINRFIGSDQVICSAELKD